MSMYGVASDREIEEMKYNMDSVEYSIDGIMKQKVMHPYFDKYKPSHGKLSPGVYILSKGAKQGPVKMESHNVSGDEIIVFRGQAIDLVKREIKEFWELKNHFESVKLIHKRGIILHGLPGSGKTTLLRQIMSEMVRDGNIVVICDQPYYLVESLREFRKEEPNRKICVIMEDIDELARWSEHTILEALDGSNSINSVLYLGTTNHLNEMSERLKRPGRFDRKVEIPNPDYQIRYQYLKKKLEGRERSDLQVQRLARLTEGMSFGALREVVVSVYGYKYPISETIERLKKECAPKSQSTEDKLMSLIKGV